MEEIDKSTRLAPTQRAASLAAPVMSGMGVIPGLLVSKAIQESIKAGKTSAAFYIVETWNQQFFKPRGLDV
jgi:hypothetical protein